MNLGITSCGTECRVVGAGIFLDGAAGRSRRRARGTLDTRRSLASAWIKLASTQNLRRRPGLRGRSAAGRLEQPSQQIGLAKAATAVLREGRVVRHRAVEPEPAEPPVGKVRMTSSPNPTPQRNPALPLVERKGTALGRLPLPVSVRSAGRSCCFRTRVRRARPGNPCIRSPSRTRSGRCRPRRRGWRCGRA